MTAVTSTCPHGGLGRVVARAPCPMPLLDHRPCWAPAGCASGRGLCNHPFVLGPREQLRVPSQDHCSFQGHESQSHQLLLETGFISSHPSGVQLAGAPCPLPRLLLRVWALFPTKGEAPDIWQHQLVRPFLRVTPEALCHRSTARPGDPGVWLRWAGAAL